MAEPKELKGGDPVSRNWREINALIRSFATFRTQFSRIRDIVAQLETDRRIWQAGGGGKVEQFRFKTMGADTIVCVRWNGTTEGEQVTIYKPWKLRRTPWHGQTVSIATERLPAIIQVTYQYLSNTKRTATSPQSGTETQYVVPRYLPGDVIYASPCAARNGAYRDRTVDGRAWSEHE